MNIEVADNVTPRRAKNSMARLKDLAGVEEDSLDAVLNLCNPFPDSTVKRLGWPDSKAIGSVVVVDTYEQTITQPAGLAASETWDAHIAMLPVAFTSVFGGTGNITTGGAVGGTAAVLADVASSLVIKTSVTGGLMDPLVVAGAKQARYVYSYGAQAQGSMHRIVAQGLEIVNTTAELYKGGMAYGYRYAAANKNGFWSPSAAAPISGVCTFTGAPPDTPADIVNYGNTYEGPARDGAYVINCPSDMTNDLVVNPGAYTFFLATPGAQSSNYTLAQGAGTVNGWCFAGSFLTGLAQGSSLVVRYRTYLEVFPLPSDGNNLIRLTNPTVARNPIVDEILNVVLRDMPAGCPYTHNPLGEWFNSLMESIEAIAPMVGGAFGPIGGLIGGGVSHLAKGARKINGGKKKHALVASKTSGQKSGAQSSEVSTKARK